MAGIREQKKRPSPRRSFLWVLWLIGAFIIATVLLFLIFQHTPNTPTSVIGRVPKAMFASLLYGTVRPNSEIIILGDGSIGVSGHSSIVFIGVGSGGYRKILEIGGKNTFPAVCSPMRHSISPDGRCLLFSYKFTSSPVGMVDLTTGRLLWNTPCNAIVALARRPFSDDGTRFVAKRYMPFPELWLFESATGKPIKRIGTLANPKRNGLTAYGFIPGQSKVEYLEYGVSDKYWTVDVDGGKPVSSKAMNGHLMYQSPDGSLGLSEDISKRKTLFGKIDVERVVLLDRSGKELRELCSYPGDHNVMQTIWSPDSKYVALTIRPRKPKLRLPLISEREENWQTLIAHVASGRTIARFKDKNNDVMILDWYPDSRAVACVTETVDNVVIYKLQVK